MPTFHALAAGEPPASELLAEMVGELQATYGGRIDAPGSPSATPEEMAPPHGTFLVGFEDGEPVCGGGVKRLDDGVAEIKRMYVAPHARSRGVARALLAALEDAARDLGYDRARLDTGARQPHARTLYEASGYRSIPDYNGNPYAAFWGEKRLRGEDA
jgi:GNAT superfamily N-acetyltransferase